MQKPLDEKSKTDGNLVTRNYRLLAKYKKNKNLNNVWLKENYLDNGVNEKTDISNNIKGVKGKNKETGKRFLNKGQYNIEFLDNNTGMFDGKYFHFDKKLIKKKEESVIYI
ncbi:hypothetical protein PMALA_066860 [Plasmodium malariae]|uniref:Uncharacterized protein n=1 Tax=Plasmodium malariae TaxID=5858 RepID=A0A1A8X357_PLAMA|nr:hypothetical protein PMALA_066860 [Plasmodium malariae]